MDDPRTTEDLRSEVRYSERLCERTARLYRRLQTFLTFMAVVGGSAAVVGVMSSTMQPALPLAGAAVLALFGGIAVAVRPGDKAAMAEVDMRRYSSMRAGALTMTREQLALAIEQARPADTPEIEPLRDVAWNDVVTEIGRQDAAVPLRWKQRLVAALA